MDADAVKKALKELYPHLEWQETQITALLEFLTAKGIISDQEFAPFVEAAGKRSSVKWLAARLRIEHALSGSAEEEEKPAEISTKPPAQEPEEQRPQENESWQASDKSDKSDEKPDRDREERQPEQTGKSAEPGEQPEEEAA